MTNDLTVLIVPYGIEINYHTSWNVQCRVLIVPYGIEMIHPVRKGCNDHTVLIVPYGIEIIFMVSQDL